MSNRNCIVIFLSVFVLGWLLVSCFTGLKPNSIGQDNSNPQVIMSTTVSVIDNDFSKTALMILAISMLLTLTIIVAVIVVMARQYSQKSRTRARRKRIVIFSLIFAATSLLSSCATPYQPEGFLSGGYKDLQIKILSESVLVVMASHH